MVRSFMWINETNRLSDHRYELCLLLFLCDKVLVIHFFHANFSINETKQSSNHTYEEYIRRITRTSSGLGNTLELVYTKGTQEREMYQATK